MPRPNVRAVLGLAAVLATVLAGSAAAGGQQVRGGVTRLATIDDAGHATTFPLYWAAPAHPKAVVVVFHGTSHNADEWPPELATIARQGEVAAVAPRTVESKTNKGPFNSVDEEARDAAAGIAWARAHFHVRTTYVFCVSMGCSGFAYFVDAASRPTAGDADARWVQAHHPLPLRGVVIAEGLSNLVETWAEASSADAALGTATTPEIEQETGGTPAQEPTAFRSRSFALLPPSEIKALGLSRVAVVHDLDDGLVPFNQAVETRAALLGAGETPNGYTVIGNHPGCSSDHSTTLTHYAVPQAEPTLCLAGHNTETVPTTPVMRTSLAVLRQMVRAKYFPNGGEQTVDPGGGVGF